MDDAVVLDSLNVLQVTDTHLFPSPDAKLLGINTCESLHAVMRQAFAEQVPDVLLATGDIAQLGERKTYELFLEIVAQYYDGPMLCVPGNHDVWDVFSSMLPIATIQAGGWRIIGIDTHIDDHVEGLIGDDGMAALDAELAADSAPTLLVGHHAPVDVGAGWLDGQRIGDADSLINILKANDHIRAYVFGHVHQIFEDDIEGIPVMSAPSTCFQFVPRSKRFSIDESAKPGYRWLRLKSDGSYATRVTRLGDFELTLDLTETKY